jgi:thioesterase domain-containing protein/acyl carrier protein
MIPASITVTEELPRSPNGKVDRRALLATAKPQPLATVRPGTSSEELLGELFAEALGLPDVRPGDDFFDLGGHSITAAQLLVRLRQVLQVELTMRDIFEAPSAAQLAERLRLSRESASGSEYATLLPLRAGGRLAPVFCVHPGIGLSWTYAGLLRHLPVDHPVYGLQSPAFTGGGLALGIRELAVNYADQILALRPSSTCHLLGWSYGGLVAHAIAAELRRHGVQVGLLGLLDAYPTAKDALEARRPPGKQEIFGQLLSSVGYEVADTEVTFSALVERLRSAGGPLQSIPAVRIPAVIRIFSEHIRHMTGYQPPVYDGDLTIWRAVVDAYGRSLPPRGYQWRAFVGGHLTELPVSTSHGRMGLPEGLSLIGPQIAGRLAQHEV